MNNNLEREGIFYARSITKTYAKTFYFSSYLLSKEKQNAAFVIYALCRLSDEAVDGNSQINRLDNLSLLEEKINSAYNKTKLNDPLLAAFRKTVRTYAIPVKYFECLLSGMRMDIQKNRYSDFNELSTYCYNVAGVVGLIMLCVFETKNKEAEKFAIDLGIAMQLTNILRDIKEDFRRNRVYLPREEMKKFLVDESHIKNEIIDEKFVSLIKFQISRARMYYENAEEGIKMIKDRRCRISALAMKEIYARILDKIEINNYDIFSTRAYVGKKEKLSALWKIFMERKYI